MPPIIVKEVGHLTRSKGLRKTFITSLIPTLEQSGDADPFNTPDNLNALAMNLEVAEEHIHSEVEAQGQIQNIRTCMNLMKQSAKSHSVTWRR